MDKKLKIEENPNEIYNDLDEEDKKEIKDIEKEIKKIEVINVPIRDKNLKKRIAKICLKLIEETPKNKILIKETSYLIVGFFFRYSYDDELEEIIGIAGELELPEHHVYGGIFKRWEEMKNKFQHLMNFYNNS